MIRNFAITGLVSILMGIFSVAYTSLTPPRDLTTMAGASVGASDTGVLATISDQEGLLVFRQQIRPLFAASCWECHDSKKRSGGLDLTHRETALAGGETGDAIVPGKPGESLMFQLVTAGEMPKKGGTLSSSQVAAIKEWIERGAPYDVESDAPTNPASNAMNAGTPMALGKMKMCPCMEMMMGMSNGMGMNKGMTSGQANQPTAAAQTLSNPRTTDQARQRAEDHLKALGNPN